MFCSSQDGIETSSTWPHFILNLRFSGVGPGLGHGSLKGISKNRQVVPGAASLFYLLQKQAKRCIYFKNVHTSIGATAARAFEQRGLFQFHRFLFFFDLVVTRSWS